MFFKKVFENFLGESHCEKWPAIAEIIFQGFPFKWAKINQSFPFLELCVFKVHWLFLSLKFI